MTKRMLIDATHAEETRVVVLDGNRLEDFDVETSTKKQLKGNIYLAKVVRVEPSLQAAFVEYGGGRHGFLAFGEIHPDYYQIPVADRQRLLALQAEEARAEEEAEAVEFGREEVFAQPVAEPAERAPLEPADAPHQNHIPSAYAAAEIVVADDDQTFQSIDAPIAPDAGHGAGPNDEGQSSIGGAASETVGSNSIEPIATEPPADGAQALQVTFGKVTYGASFPEGAELRSTAGAFETAEGAEEAGSPEGAEIVDEADRMPAPEVIGGENDTTDGFGAAQARVRSASRILRTYRIQEVIRRRQILLIQVVKEERGTKGAALTTYISLAGRFCVLMPNSPRGGGISRKITSAADRRRLKEITAELEVPKGMGLIVRTAGAARPKPEIRRDCEYLMRLWDDIREHTMQSVAPALIYEEASLIKRAIRDVYSREVSEILVDGEDAWRSARDFMRMLMPDHAKKVQLWRPGTQGGVQGAGGLPLFAAEQVEAQLDAMNSPTVQLKSGGYLVINQTEALVAIDVNSGRSTRERGIEETALKTNLEAADEVARQLRLRDLAGLIVIDFIDMEARRHNTMVEKRIQDALKSDRARIQIGHISHFGLLEMSRQRLRPSLAETSFVTCPHCGGSGHMRSTESSAIHVLRGIEEECGKMRGGQILVHMAGSVAMYLLNHKRDRLSEMEQRFVMRVHLAGDDSLPPPRIRVDRIKAALSDSERPIPRPMVPAAPEPLDARALEAAADEDVLEIADEAFGDEVSGGNGTGDEELEAAPRTEGDNQGGDKQGGDEAGRSRRRRRRGRGPKRDDSEALLPEAAATQDAATPHQDEAAEPPEAAAQPMLDIEPPDDGQAEQPAIDASALDENGLPKARRRGRRGGRRRRRDGSIEDGAPQDETVAEPEPPMPAYTGPTPADPFGARPFDIYDLMDEEPPLDIPPMPVVSKLPEPHEEPSTARAADFEPAASVEPTFEPQPEPAPEIPAAAAEAAFTPAAPEPVPPEPAAPEPVAETETEAVPEPEPAPEPGPVYAPVLVGAGDAPRAAPKRGWWRR